MPARSSATIPGRDISRRFAACRPSPFSGRNCPNGSRRSIRRSEWMEGRVCPYMPCSDYCRFPTPFCLWNIARGGSLVARRKICRSPTAKSVLMYFHDMCGHLNFIGPPKDCQQRPDQHPSAHEWVIVFLLLVACLIFNMATYRLYPAEWSDEVSFSEPAVNFAQTGLFTTRVWPYQPVNTFPVLNCPCYSLSLAGWVSLMGVSLLAIRSFNYALAGGVAFLSWACSWKLGLVSVRLRVWRLFCS